MIVFNICNPVFVSSVFPHFTTKNKLSKNNTMSTLMITAPQEVTHGTPSVNNSAPSTVSFTVSSARSDVVSLVRSTSNSDGLPLTGSVIAATAGATDCYYAWHNKGSSVVVIKAPDRADQAVSLEEVTALQGIARVNKNKLRLPTDPSLFANLCALVRRLKMMHELQVVAELLALRAGESNDLAIGPPSSGAQEAVSALIDAWSQTVQDIGARLFDDACAKT
ncbi:MAG: hypothetical protein Q8M03_16405, partial [Legionella sp.]|nr:hypothetical protein [Legionella sp.]